MDCGPRSTKSPKNKKSASGGRPAASNNRSRSPYWPCRSPTTLMGTWSRNSIGCRRNARRALAHRASTRSPSLHRPNRSPATPSLLSLRRRRDMTGLPRSRGKIYTQLRDRQLNSIVLFIIEQSWRSGLGCYDRQKLIVTVARSYFPHDSNFAPSRQMKLLFLGFFFLFSGKMPLFTDYTAFFKYTNVFETRLVC